MSEHEDPLLEEMREAFAQPVRMSSRLEYAYAVLRFSKRPPTVWEAEPDLLPLLVRDLDKRVSELEKGTA